MNPRKIAILFLALVFPAMAFASEPEPESDQQPSSVNILGETAERSQEVTVRAMTLREILLQRLREKHAAGLDTDIPESFIENLSDEAIEEIFRQADEKDAASGIPAGDGVEEQREEFQPTEEPQSWLDYLKNGIIAAATALVGGATAWLAQKGFAYNDEGESADKYDNENIPVYTEQIGEGFVDPEKLYKAIRWFGYNKIAACAILGNIGQESTFNTYASNKGKYIGLCQWQVEREKGETSSRWENLLEFARVNECNPYEATTQLNFMYYEVATTWRSEWCTPEDVNKCQSVEEATIYWQEFFEGAIGQETEERIDNARKFYEQFS